MRAVVFEGNGKVAVAERPDPRVTRPDDVLIQIAANGLCGSDLRALATPPEMIYDEGVVIGHEFSGTVVATGDEAGIRLGAHVIVHPNIWCQRCASCRSGRTNLCEHFVHIGSMRDGGAAELCVVPARMVYELGAELPLQLAALTEPLACVLNGTTTAALHPGESAVVIGAGPIGLLYLMLFKAAGAGPVIVSEPAERRAGWARELGADEVVDPTAGSLTERVLDRTDGRGVDVAVDTVGSRLEDAIPTVRKAGRVLIFGLNERARATIEPAVLAYREIAVQGVYIAKGSFPLAVRLLTANTLGFDRLVSRTYPLDEVAQAIDDLRAGTLIKGLLTP